MLTLSPAKCVIATAQPPSSEPQVSWDKAVLRMHSSYASSCQVAAGVAVVWHEGEVTAGPQLNGLLTFSQGGLSHCSKSGDAQSPYPTRGSFSALPTRSMSLSIIVCTCDYLVAQLCEGLSQSPAVGHNLELVDFEFCSHCLLQGHSNPWIGRKQVRKTGSN